jgi:hypothetical protein
VKVAVKLITLLLLSKPWNTIASPRPHPVLALVQEAGDADVAITVDESDHGGVFDLALASACKICDRTYPPQPRLDRFQPTTDPGELGKLLPHETLARVEPLPRLQTTPRTTALGRRSSSNRAARDPRTVSATPGWPASHLGRIWPRSGEARPDPAYFLFFSECSMISELVLWFKSD